MAIRAVNWTNSKLPYDTLVYLHSELEGDADDEQIKAAYRHLVKFYHPDVYDGRGTLEEGELAKAQFIKIQAAYELLRGKNKCRQCDIDNRVDLMKLAGSSS